MVKVAKIANVEGLVILAILAFLVCQRRAGINGVIRTALPIGVTLPLICW
jgi:hypothetical protein